MVEPKIEESWKTQLWEEFQKPYFEDLRNFLVAEREAGHRIYPPGSQIFSACNCTPFDKIKVVILGQDPYHGNGQANGLCFSVSDGVKHPPSLQNIFRELQSDLGIRAPRSGNLESWARQGVLLLNATLTVRANQPGSHQNKGWETFTDEIITKMSEHLSGVIFLLWGKFAQAKEWLIDPKKHYILKAAHPSPYSANAGFFGCKHFSKANELLTLQGKETIDWRVGSFEEAVLG